MDEPTELKLINDANKDQYDEAKEKKMIEYEEMMRVIKEATGVNDIQEVIDKFNAQADTHSHLAQMQKANEKRIDDLKKKREHVLSEYEELKYSGESKHAHSKRVIEEFKSHYDVEQNKCQDAKAKFERSGKLLSNAKAGVQHLYEKLEGIHLVCVCFSIIP